MAKKSGTTPGDVVRFVPAPEPMVATVSIGILTVLEIVFAMTFLGVLVGTGFATVLGVLGGIFLVLAILLIFVQVVLVMMRSRATLMGRVFSLGAIGIGLFVAAIPAYIGGLGSGNGLREQQVEALLLGGALLTLAAILSLYRKFFLPDVMIVKKRKLKYEDLM